MSKILNGSNRFRKEKTMKNAKKIIIVLASVIVLYCALCIIECTRLKKMNMYSKPIISLHEETHTGYAKYFGLGYSVKYDAILEPVEKDGEVYQRATEIDATFSVFGIKVSSWTQD